ncbi:MAG: HAD family hydrolase [Lachnospiraceae bacterium]|nr:HAD family hydrolase [Lachnospiraceae bacterium]MDD3614835.1 HAD family hydrolase [Lachnospiraceae bacterium]
MIKLIASDIDGTLLVEGQDRINPEMFEVIRGLKEKGVIFAAASGRQYNSIRHVFAPVENDMIFICENGSNVICRGVEMASTVLKRQDAEDLTRFIRSLPDCYLTASTKGPMYVEDTDEEFMNLLLNGYHNDIRKVPDILAEDIEIIKMSIFRHDGIAQMVDGVVEEWKDRFRVVQAGEPWIDFMDYQADKGNALKTIQKKLHITQDETMVFGDNHNDLGMLASAGESYAVANAQPAVKEAAKHITLSNTDDGVLKVMKELWYDM